MVRWKRADPAEVYYVRIQSWFKVWENRHTKGIPYMDLSDVGEVRVSREDLGLT
jgi:hypothetical protein